MYQSGEISIKEYTARLSENTTKLTANKNEMSTLSNENKNLLKIQEAIPTSMNEISLQLANLRKQYKGMTQEERESPIGKEMLKNIESLDTEIKDLDSNIGNNQRNVGNYPTVFQNAGNSMKNLGSTVLKFAGQLGLIVGAGALIKGSFEQMKSASQSFGDGIKTTMAGAKESTSAFFRTLASGDWSNLIGKMQEAGNQDGTCGQDNDTAVMQRLSEQAMACKKPPARPQWSNPFWVLVA
jgi:hypothetical protein